MINILRTTAIGVAMAGTLAVATATPSLARVVHPGYHHAGPHSGYAYAPADDDTGGYSTCYPTLRWQNRC
jgi:hypothetical protein